MSSTRTPGQGRDRREHPRRHLRGPLQRVADTATAAWPTTDHAATPAAEHEE
ncbi:hypothetical protein [Actinomadura violacea]|uniref:Uncharacterized protein n=1 Tax=Actinomadura violacea TaxID=2819934 RepID=A0ABS3RM77_9ACTN|nr:hypothetical protein [Actinomadura violacea]MBO2457179.1 hypothetical protein [Actinomadura violacea]